MVVLLMAFSGLALAAVITYRSNAPSTNDIWYYNNVSNTKKGGYMSQSGALFFTITIQTTVDFYPYYWLYQGTGKGTYVSFTHGPTAHTLSRCSWTGGFGSQNLTCKYYT